MSKFRETMCFVWLAATLFFTQRHAEAETLHLSKKLTDSELYCLQELLTQYFAHSRATNEVGKLITEASAATAYLRGSGKPAFIFVIRDIGYCGSAGCMMLIGERRLDGKCHVLADANNDGGDITILRHRDHGYRRLYAPCELYFDGRQYLQVREECPTAKVHR